MSTLSYLMDPWANIPPVNDFAFSDMEMLFWKLSGLELTTQNIISPRCPGEGVSPFSDHFTH